MTDIPDKSVAVQLVAKERLELNRAKTVALPEDRQILCKVLVVGLCFSDMKLLKQFAEHVRKSDVESGVERDVIDNLPSYVPNEKATVPGHETVVEVVAVGDRSSDFKLGERYVVQADWRWLKTRESNGAFGYNFEGGLQEYVLLDERLLKSPEGESMLLPIENDSISLSALALVEPWACVEQSYQSTERRGILPGGRVLAVDDLGDCSSVIERIPMPANTECERLDLAGAALAGEAKRLLRELDGEYDDIVYIGNSADHLESLFKATAKGCLINVVTCGNRFGRDVETPLGDVHYRGIRICGTTGSDPSQGYRSIPESSELRTGDRIHVVGAGGPMGVMHVVRNLCQGIAGIELVAADLSDSRLEALASLAEPLAKKNQVGYAAYNPHSEQAEGRFDYSVIMAPVPALVAEAVDLSADGAIINIFAGIPAGRSGAIDFDAYLEKGLYFIGTSGSTMRDMKIVKSKVESRTLDTNLSVAAISGLDGAIDGLMAVANQTITGKILVYPDCKGLGLTPLEDLAERFPSLADKLEAGIWSKAAEVKLLQMYK